MKTRLTVSAIAAAMVLASAHDVLAQAKGALMLKDGNRVTGVLTYRAASRAYEIKDGRISRTVSVDQVQDVRVQHPQGLASAVNAVNAGRYSGPHIQELKTIVDQYWMLQHDVLAGWDPQTSPAEYSLALGGKLRCGPPPPPAPKPPADQPPKPPQPPPKPAPVDTID